MLLVKLKVHVVRGVLPQEWDTETRRRRAGSHHSPLQVVAPTCAAASVRLSSFQYLEGVRMVRNALAAQNTIKE